MTSRRLVLETERAYRTNETAKVKVSLRNVEKLTVRRYTLDLEAFFRKTHAARGVEDLDVALIQPDRTWTVEVADYRKYAPIVQEIEIPFPGENPGVCLVTVGEEDLESTTLVLRSDIDLIVRGNRSEVLVFAQDMRRDAPAEGVSLLLSDGESVFATATTGKDGVYRGRHDELKGGESLRVLAVSEPLLDHEGPDRPAHFAAHAVDLSGLETAAGLLPRGYVYTDRPAYLPGQTVGIRAILRDVKDGSYVAPAGAPYVVTISDPRGRVLRRKNIFSAYFLL